MNAAGARSRNTDAELAGVFRVSARHERRGLFVAHLNETDLFPALAQRLHNAVDPVAWQAEDDFHSPVVNRIDQNISRGLSHESFSLKARESPKTLSLQPYFMPALLRSNRGSFPASQAIIP